MLAIYMLCKRWALPLGKCHMIKCSRKGLMMGLGQFENLKLVVMNK